MDAMMISKQWANRPDDERFASMHDLHEFNLAKRERSQEKGVALDHLRLGVDPNGGLLLGDREKAVGANLTHWAFGQLCQRVHAPAGYLRQLPAGLAAIPLQWSMETAREDAKLLIRRDAEEDHWTVDAVTSDTYGRIYDAAMSQAIMERVDLEVWKVPSASYASTNPKRATTLYASDRDCFIALVDDKHPIEVPGGNGKDTLFRGFICRNSEVGAATYDLFLFLYRMICDNRIIHGLSSARQLKIRHTSGGPMRFMYEAQPALYGYLTAGTQDTVGAILAAREKTLGRTEADVTAWLKARGFTQSVANRANELAAEEPGNPRSLWNVVNGLTAAAHEVKWGDERLDLEQKASKLLDVVVN